jgi:hypothetical protein
MSGRIPRPGTKRGNEMNEVRLLRHVGQTHAQLVIRVLEERFTGCDFRHDGEAVYATGSYAVEREDIMRAFACGALYTVRLLDKPLRLDNKD